MIGSGKFMKNIVTILKRKAAVSKTRERFFAPYCLRRRWIVRLVQTILWSLVMRSAMSLEVTPLLNHESISSLNISKLISCAGMLIVRVKWSAVEIVMLQCGFCDFDFPKNWCVVKLVIAHRKLGKPHPFGPGFPRQLSCRIFLGHSRPPPLFNSTYPAAAAPPSLQHPTCLFFLDGDDSSNRRLAQGQRRVPDRV